MVTFFRTAFIFVCFFCSASSVSHAGEGGSQEVPVVCKDKRFSYKLVFTCYEVKDSYKTIIKYEDVKTPITIVYNSVLGDPVSHELQKTHDGYLSVRAVFKGKDGEGDFSAHFLIERVMVYDRGDKRMKEAQLFFEDSVPIHYELVPNEKEK